MIYRIVVCDGNGPGTDIYGPDAEMAVLNPHLEIELNSAGSLEFTLPVENINWNVPNVFQNEIEVWEDDKIIWFGRPLQIIRDWNNQRRVVCEGALSYFNDSIQRTWEQQPATNKTNISFFRHLINGHNNDVMNNKNFIADNITIESTPAYRKTDYDTTLDCLQNMCLAVDGGYFILRKEYIWDVVRQKDVAQRYIDWYEELPDNAMQDVQFGVNLLDISQDLNGADICTVLIVSGKDDVMLNELGNKNPDTNNGVGHDSGSDEIYYAPGVATYGRIIQQKSWNDYSDINELWRKAKTWMIEKNTDIPTIECSAADLYYINDPDMVVDGPLQVGMKVQVVSAPHDFNKQLLMYKISMDLDSGVKKVTLGTPPKKELTDIVAPSSGGSSTSGGKGAAGGSSESGSGSGSGSQTVIAPVQDVKVKWPDTDVYTSVVKKKTAKIDLTEVGKVLDVWLNGTSVVDNKIAKINIERILYGTTNPLNSLGKNGDVYLKIIEGGEVQEQDLFGTPDSNVTEDGIITETGGGTVYQQYLPYKAFGDNIGGGRNNTGNYIVTYQFTNDASYKPTHVKFSNNFTVNGGYLTSKVIFQVSSDGQTWLDLVTKNDLVTRDTYYETDIAINAYFKYFRFKCSGATGYTGIKGIEVTGYPLSTGDVGISNIYFKNDGTWLKDIKDITDVKVDGTSVVNDHEANIIIPVKDVTVNNSSVVDQQGTAKISIPVKDVRVDSATVVDENGIAQLDSDDFGKVDDVRVDGESVVTNKIAELDGPYINYPDIELIADIDNTDSSYSYSDGWRKYRLSYYPDENAPGAYLVICIGRELSAPTIYVRMHKSNRLPDDPADLNPIDEISKNIYHGYYKNNQSLGYCYSSFRASLFNNVGIADIENSHFIDIQIKTDNREPTVNTAWGMDEVPNYLFRFLVYKITGLKSGVCGKFLNNNLYGYYNDSNDDSDFFPPLDYIFDDEINSSEIFLHYVGLLGGYNTHATGELEYDHPSTHMKNIRMESDFLPWPQYDQKQACVTIDRSTKDMKPRVIFPIRGHAVENQQSVDPPYYFNVTAAFFGIHFYVTNSNSDIVPNPQEQATDSLETIKIDDIVYDISGSGGSDVEANPSGTPTDDLETIRIGNTVYDIPGGGSSGKTLFMSDYYSTEEHVVGRWLNGKPLYQKTITVQASSLTSTETTLAHGIADVDYICMTKGTIIKMGTGASSDLLTYHSSYSWAAGIYNLNRTSYTYYVGSDLKPYVSSLKITFQYTKTTDAPGTGPTPGNIIYLPAIYSEEEHEVGVWIDGKPLYQRTYDLGSSGVTISSSSWTDTSISKGNISEIINCIGMAPNGASKSLVATVNNSANNVISLQTTENGNKTVRYFTIQYTKTTDAPGSGTWTPDGSLAHHYSASEHIVGTWIDGKTLYERTITIPTMPNNAVASHAHGISGVDAIWVFDGFARNSTTGYVNPLNLPNSSTSGQWYTNVDRTNINIWAGSDRRSYDDVKVTVRYTKL